VTTQWNRVFKVSLNKQGTSESAYIFYSPLLQIATCHFLQQLNVVTIYTITNTLQLSIYTSINTFIDLKLLALALQSILDTLSDILVKCLRFSLIKIESVSIFQAKPRLVSSSQSVVYTFLLKMLYLVLIKNLYSLVF
jgi:hypothetical protein